LSKGKWASGAAAGGIWVDGAMRGRDAHDGAMERWAAAADRRNALRDARVPGSKSARTASKMRILPQKGSGPVSFTLIVHPQFDKKTQVASQKTL